MMTLSGMKFFFFSLSPKKQGRRKSAGLPVSTAIIPYPYKKINFFRAFRGTFFYNPVDKVDFFDYHRKRKQHRKAGGDMDPAGSKGISAHSTQKSAGGTAPPAFFLRAD